MKKTLRFDIEKETKGTFRYAEQGNEQVIGTIYVRKHVFGSDPAPKVLTVTIEG